MDAKDIINSQRGYSNVIQSDQDPPNPLAGRQAFTGSTIGYVSTQLDLTSLAGQSVQFRFRMGTDKFTYRYGWLVDDVAIYSCSPPGLVVSATSGLTTSEGGTAATFNIKLAVAPTSAVVLTVTSSEIGEGIVTPSSLTFTPENWSQEQEITVTGVADNLSDGDRNYTVMIAVHETNDTAGFAIANAATISITNLDDRVGASGSRRGGGGSFDVLVFGLLLLVHRFFCDGIYKIQRRRNVTAV